MEVGGKGELGDRAVLGEGAAGGQWIDAYAHDLSVLLRKAVVVPLEVAELTLSAAGEVGDVPGEDELLAAQLGQCEPLARKGLGQGEVGGRLANLDRHGMTPFRLGHGAGSRMSR